MSAEISHCGTYRYVLSRPSIVRFPEKGTALFCMLNPSTADATVDDPTIRRCRGFAKDWFCNGFTVVNLYALRATDPRELWKHPDPVGPANDGWLKSLAHEYGDVVCAWGANAREDRVRHVVGLFLSVGARLWHLGLTKAGAPRHPLYIRADQPLERWTPAFAEKVVA